MLCVLYIPYDLYMLYMCIVHVVRTVPYRTTREKARTQAEAQEDKARRSAKARAASDAEFHKKWRETSTASDGAAAGPPGTREGARIAARAEDDTRWRTFEGRIGKLASAASASSSGIRASDIPWPSGPPGNPLYGKGLVKIPI